MIYWVTIFVLLSVYYTKVSVTFIMCNWEMMPFVCLPATWMNAWDWGRIKRRSQRCTTQWDVSKLHFPPDATRWWYWAQDCILIAFWCTAQVFVLSPCTSRNENSPEEVWTSQTGGGQYLQAKVGEDSRWICHFKQVRTSDLLLCALPATWDIFLNPEFIILYIVLNVRLYFIVKLKNIKNTWNK